jgi:hypothetical protein
VVNDPARGIVEVGNNKCEYPMLLRRLTAVTPIKSNWTERLIAETTKPSKELLDKIEEQQAEIRRLNAMMAGVVINHLAGLDDANDEVTRLQAENETLRSTQKRLLDALRSIAHSIDNSCIENDWLDGDAEWAMALADEIDPPQGANLDLPYDGETPLGIALDGGAGDDL